MKRLLVFFLILCTLPVFPVYAEQATDLTLSAPSAILIEAGSGQVLYEKNSHDRRPPASVTKIMTLLLVMEAIDNGQIALEDMVRCSEYAASMGGSQVYLEPGEEMSVRDMLKAVAVASGNDAAVALSEHISGSAEAFVNLMNDRAKALGMNDTHFVNCNGLDDPEHLTSAYDIALMSRELVKHPLIFEFTGIWMDSLRGGQFGLVNTNKLIRFYTGANGLKTGSTSVAKYCLSASAQRDGMNLIAVVLGAETSKERFADASRLLDYGFANFSLVQPSVDTDTNIPVKLGKETSVKAIPNAQNSLIIDKSQKKDVSTEVTLEPEISAPVTKGQRLGTMTVKAGDHILAEIPMVAEMSVERLSFWDLFLQVLKSIAMAK